MLHTLLKPHRLWGYMVILTLMGCGNPKIIEDTAQLDQAFIPLLYVSEHVDTTTTETMRMFDRFVRRWHLFYGNYYTANQINPKWGQSLDQINQKVNAIEDSLVDRHSLSGIHTMLEFIRHDLTQLRRENQIAYPLDEFTAFHAIMDPMWAAADSIEMQPEKSDQYVKPILHNMTTAEKQWMRAQMVRIDPILYELSEEEERQLRQGIQAIQSKLNELNAAANRHDATGMAELAKAIKHDFEKIYLLFGDFD
ncbi:MAG: hypothetical protein K9M19_01060 [Candidatus Marinimicrobia bacterium]|nr:hypothetical protein [Candidatus Neomarinimicrobiota bacterium]